VSSEQSNIFIACYFNEGDSGKSCYDFVTFDLGDRFEERECLRRDDGVAESFKAV
jgi:hypothetical protein